MQPYQQRVVDEKTELDSKRGRLQSFIAGSTFSDVPEVERERLTRQLEAMTLYSNILAERVAAFE